LERQLAAVATVTAAVAQTQCLQLLIVHETFMMARSTPEVYVVPDERMSRTRVVELAERCVAFELAVRLNLSENTIRDMFHDAHTLITKLPRVWDSFRTGQIPYVNARTAAGAARALPDDDPTVFERLDEVLAVKGAGMVPSKFRTAARVLREKLHPENPVTRHEKAFADRRVSFDPDQDGMGWITLFTDAATVVKAQAYADAVATRMRAKGDDRTLEQLRADAIADLLTGRGTKHEVKARVTVTVPVTAFTDQPELLQAARTDPGVLDGYGPIDPVTAGRLAAAATTFRRLFTDPIDGAELNLGRTSYKPNKAQREWLRRRYGTCVAPTCNCSAVKSDTDHALDWVFDGYTNENNLGPLHRGHHTLRHKTTITVERLPDGRYRWTTPTGFTRDNDPPPF
jgi:hypothetical protein